MDSIVNLRARLVGFWYRAEWPLTATAIGLLLFASPLKIVGFLVLLFVTARLLSRWFAFFTSLVVAYLMFAAATAMLAVVFWSIGIDFSLIAVAGIWTLSIVAGLLWLPNIPSLRPTRAEVTSSHDLVALGLSIAAMLIIAWPVVANPTLSNTARSLLGGGDNTTHLEIIKAIDLNKGVVYGQSNHYNTPPLYSVYPSGWHINVAVFKWMGSSLRSDVPSTNMLLVAYFASTVLWFGMLVYLMIITALTALKAARARAMVLATCVIAGVTLGWIITMFAFGHQSHIAFSVFALLQVLALCTAYAQPTSKKHPTMPKHSFWVYLALMGASGAFLCYYFGALVIAVTFVTGYVLYKLYAKTWPTLAEILVAGVAAAICLREFYVRYQYSYLFEDSGESIFQVSGLVAKSDFAILAVLFMIAVAGVLYFRKHRYVVALTVAVGSLVALSGIVQLLYVLHDTEPGYYIYKINLSCIIGLAILYAILAGLALDQLSRGMARKLGIIASCLLILATAQAGFMLRAPEYNGFVTSTNFGADARMTEQLLSVLGEDPMNGNRAIALGSCNRAEDIRLTQLARSLGRFPDSNRPTPYSPMGLGIHDKAALFADIKDYQQAIHQKVIVIANDRKLATDLQAYLGPQASQFRFIHLDPDLYQETALQCPERTRDLVAEPLPLR